MAFCAKCGNQMDDAAAFCTKCGTVRTPIAADPSPALHPRLKKFTKRLWIAIGVSVVGLVAIIALSPSDENKKTPAGDSAAPVEDVTKPKTVNGENHIGCTDRDYFEKLASYAAVKDTEAFTRALGAALLTGDCVTFKAGEPVFLVDTAIFSGLVKVRRLGETTEYWTNIETTAAAAAN